MTLEEAQKIGRFVESIAASYSDYSTNDLIYELNVQFKGSGVQWSFDGIGIWCMIADRSHTYRTNEE